MKLTNAALVAVISAYATALPVGFFPYQSILDLGKQLFEDKFVPQPVDTSEGQPKVDTSEIQNLISASRLESRANQLYHLAEQSIEERGHPTRVIGSEGHDSTVEYIINSLNHDYYSIRTQDFDAVSGSVNDYSFTVDGESPRTLSAMALTPPTKDHKAVTANLSSAANFGCELSDFDGLEPGSIVVVQRGNCPFGQKSVNAGKSGAVACLIYNNEGDDQGIAGTLGQVDDDIVPTLGVSKNDGIKFGLQNIGKPATILVDSEVGKIVTTNVIAETREGDHDNVVMLGAHSDSVAEGPGINDDGSGSISLLEVAGALTNFNVTNAVRFAWWAAEEEGLVGSDYYADHLSPEENLKVRLFMDYDMMASPNYAYQVYNANNVDNPKGSEELRDLYVEFYKSIGVNYTFIPFDGRSDYDGFIRNGIPGGGVATGAEGLKTPEEVEMFGGKAGEQYDQCYHLACDNLDNVDYDAWVVNTKLIAHSVLTYGTSLKGFPEREPSSVKVSRALKERYHGPKLVM